MIPVSESVLVSVGQQVSPIRGTQHINLVTPAFDYINSNNACLLKARDLVIATHYPQWALRAMLAPSLLMISEAVPKS